VRDVVQQSFIRFNFLDISLVLLFAFVDVMLSFSLLACYGRFAFLLALKYRLSLKLNKRYVRS
jgi:hypothetical protein